MEVDALAEAMFAECVFIPNTEGLAGTSLAGAQQSWADIGESAREIWRGRAQRACDRIVTKEQEHG